MRRKKFALGVLLLAFFAGFAGAMATFNSGQALPVDTASKHCAVELTSTWRPTS
jgi:hypothetical protein